MKYLNNIIEQDHRFIKNITRPMLGFKSFVAAQATLAEIETAYMIRKGQLPANGQNAFQQFAALAGKCARPKAYMQLPEKFATEPPFPPQAPPTHCCILSPRPRRRVQPVGRLCR